MDVRSSCVGCVSPLLRQAVHLLLGFCVKATHSMDFSQYLNSLPSDQLSALYESPWTCQAVLRSLPALAQQLVLRLLHIDDPVPDTLLRGAVKPESKEQCNTSIDLLENLQVIQRVGNGNWQLELAFRCGCASAP